jgi:hypothetical protein
MTELYASVGSNAIDGAYARDRDNNKLCAYNWTLGG